MLENRSGPMLEKRKQMEREKGEMEKRRAEAIKLRCAETDAAGCFSLDELWRANCGPRDQFSVV